MAILLCTCTHKFQDKTYGKNMRVHNYAPKGNSGTSGYRCTICKKVNKGSSVYVPISKI